MCFVSLIHVQFGEVSDAAQCEGLSPKEDKTHLQITVAEFCVQQVFQDVLPLVTRACKDSHDGWRTAHFCLLGCQPKVKWYCCHVRTMSEGRRARD